MDLRPRSLIPSRLCLAASARRTTSAKLR